MQSRQLVVARLLQFLLEFTACLKIRDIGEERALFQATAATNALEDQMKTHPPKSFTKFYTIEQIAECVEASTRTVRRWIKKKLLVAHRMNGLLRVSDADFQKFVDDHRDR